MKRLALTALLLSAAPAAAQTAALGERTITEGLQLPPESAATVENATAGTLNPAGLGLMHGLQLQYWHERELSSSGAVTGDGVYGAATILDVLAAGFSVEWLRGVQAANVTKTQFSMALSPDRSFSLGLAFNVFGSADPLFGSFTSWDAGLTWRPVKYVSLGASALSFDNPELAAGQNAPRRFDFGLGIHPVGPHFTLAADYLFVTNSPTGSPTPDGAGNGRLGLTAQLDLPFGLGIIAGAGFPIGDNRSTFGQLALTLATEHVAATASYAPSDMSTPLALGAFDVGLKLSREGFVGLPAPGARVVGVDVAGILNNKPTGVAALLANERSDPYEDLLRAMGELQNSSARAVILYLSDLGGLSLGRVEELRSVVAELRARGKKVVAYLGGGGDASYYLASACDRIYAVPQTDFTLHGFATSALYFAEGLSKIGVKVEVVRVGPYKTAPDAFTRDAPSPEQTEVTRALLTDAFERYRGAVTASRGITAQAFEKVLDRGLSTADDLYKEGMVDAILYPDEIDKTLGKLLGMPVVGEALDVKPDRHQATWGELPAVAVINVFGLITGGESQSGPFALERTAGAGTVLRQLRAAAEDRSIKAVVVRVDSGGGDGAASELIWRTIGEVRRHKPVVVSFGDVAASGGYYLALSADEILAEPSTVTGSIGVFAMKPDLSGLAEKLGIHPHSEALTPNAGIYSLATPWTDSERAVVQNSIDAFYATFVKRVADGRKLGNAEVEAIARGRVWSGEQAKQHGLIDGFGSLLDAVDHAKARAQLSAETRIQLVTFDDKPQAVVDLGTLGGASDHPQLSDVLHQILDDTGAAPALLLPRSAALALPEMLPAYR